MLLGAGDRQLSPNQLKRQSVVGSQPEDEHQVRARWAAAAPALLGWLPRLLGSLQLRQTRAIAPAARNVRAPGAPALCCLRCSCPSFSEA